MDSNHSPSARRASISLPSIQTATQSLVTASNRVLDAPMPLGMWAATAQTTSTAPTVGDIRRGSFSHNGWEAGPQAENSPTSLRRPTLPTPIVEEREEILKSKGQIKDQVPTATDLDITSPQPGAALAPVKSYPDGYIPPPKKPWLEASLVGLKGFLRWFLTPFGFFITLYGLNVVAWGGMLFLLLCGAAPKMCSPNLPRNNFDGCNDIDSPRRIWIEIDSQILNALFCVTGFGLIPWRFRDLYYLLKWRCTSERRSGRAGKMYGLRRLAGIHAGWFRLPGSDTLDEITAEQYMASAESSPRAMEAGPSAEDDERVPLPIAKTPPPPLTGVRAPPTRLWLLDFVIWGNVSNTFAQCCLCGFMWGLNRYKRPSWSTGLFIAIGCVVAGAAGIVMFVQGKRVKRCEGVAPKGYSDTAERPQREEETKEESKSSRG